MPDIVISPDFGNALSATPQIRNYSGMKIAKEPRGLRRAATASVPIRF
jgi:hypothetical protein